MTEQNNISPEAKTSAPTEANTSAANTAANNKRIAKNTIALYIRMLFTMAVLLYTSRVILQTLGVEDFGVYNVVGGVVSMFSFINAAMTSATQRYITFALGKGDTNELKKVFSTALQIHVLIAVLVVVLVETVGLWFLYNKMQIPPDRVNAAFWVLQCSIVAAVILIVSVPYNACIIAHEKMSAFAYISVVDCVLKLGIVYLLLVFPFDKLILYAILTVMVQLFIRFCYSIYCHRHFPESKYCHVWDKPLFLEMTSFAGWSFWGNLASVLSTQGVNLLLNVFFGPVVNAARGIAVQVQAAVQQFVSNFQMALNPQITKTFAKGEMEEHIKLIFSSAKYSALMLMLIATPILIETETILNIWLDNVPAHTSNFIRIILLISICDSTASALIISAQATGRVKKYQSVVGAIILLIVPFSYLSLKICPIPEIVLIIHLFIAIVAQIARLLFLKNYIKLSIRQFILKVYIPLMYTSFVIVVIPYIISLQFEPTILRLLFISLFSLCFSTFTIYLISLNKNERLFVKKAIKKVIKKISK